MGKRGGLIRNRIRDLRESAGGMTQQELADAVGMNQSALSQQLSKLRALRLVATRRDGRTIYYRLASVHVAKILEALYGLYCGPDGQTMDELSEAA